MLNQIGNQTVQTTYFIDVITQHIGVDHRDSFQRHERDEADDPWYDQRRILL